MQSAYDASAVLTCDLRDIGPTTHGGGLHTIGFDQILERLNSIGNFVHALNSDFDFEITSLPDARYLLNVHGTLRLPRALVSSCTCWDCARSLC